MPGVSRNQVVAARIAEHNPGRLYARNAGLASMKLQNLTELARTPTKGLPHRVKHKK